MKIICPKYFGYNKVDVKTFCFLDTTDQEVSLFLHSVLRPITHQAERTQYLGPKILLGAQKNVIICISFKIRKK